jgi:mersacidin/lichenicidin family type 2 lantibiotic
VNTRNIIRAWKDEEYRLSLSESERALLPAHPAGTIELGDAELEKAAGGFTSFWSCTPPKMTEQQFCTTPCTTSLVCNPCTGGGIENGPIRIKGPIRKY